MSTVTIRLPNKILEDAGIKAKKLDISRNQYIKNAIEQMNKNIYQNEKKERIIRSSKLVRKESMLVNSEFVKIEHDSET